MSVAIAKAAWNHLDTGRRLLKNIVRILQHGEDIMPVKVMDSNAARTKWREVLDAADAVVAQP